MSRPKKYPLPKPICHFCKTADPEYRDVKTETVNLEEMLLRHPDNEILAMMGHITAFKVRILFKFRCRVCKITSQYEYQDTSNKYWPMIKIDGERKHVAVPDSEWYKWAESNYTHEGFLNVNKTRHFTKRCTVYNLYKNNEYSDNLNNSENVT